MLEVKGLTKKYPAFMLDRVSFSIPKGYITGFIGLNGAGKSTTLKSILRLVVPDEGEVNIFGKSMKENELDIKRDIGFMLGEANYYPRVTVKKLTKVYSRFFDRWNDATYRKLLENYKIDENKRIRELSTGMRVKLSIAYALSHDAKLLIFDEPTSGLDPIARDEICRTFREVVDNGERSIIFSTHITSDLDKCADYVLFIREGKIVFDAPKDEVIDRHILVAGKKSMLTQEFENAAIGVTHTAFGFNALFTREAFAPFSSIGLDIGRPNVEDIIVYYNANIVEELRGKK